MYHSQQALTPLTVAQVVTLLVSLTLSVLGFCSLQMSITHHNSTHALGFSLVGVMMMVTGFVISLPGLKRTIGQTNPRVSR